MSRRPSRQRRRLARRNQTRCVVRGLRGESLESRLVLASLVDASHVASLAQGIALFADRIDQVAEHGLLGEQAAALGQPLGTLVPLGDRLRTEFVDRISGLSGAKTPAEIEAILSKATGTTVSHVSEMVGENERLWFSVPLAGSTSLPSYSLDLGQSPGDAPSGSSAVLPSLSDQGLRLGPVEVTLAAGYEGTVTLGIDLAAGVTSEESIFIKFDALRVFGRASHTGKTALADVDAEYGFLKLGPADLDVTVDSGVTLDLQEGVAGAVRLGELAGMSLPDLESRLALTATGSGITVTVPFTLDLDGFTQKNGSTQQLKITAADILDPSSLTIAYPNLTVPGVAGTFDFTQFADISAGDLGTFLADVGRWVPEVGRGFSIPVIDQDLAGLFGGSWGDWLEGKLAALKDDLGQWQFGTLQEMLELLAPQLGVSKAAFAPAWNAKVGGLEWTLPISITEATGSETSLTKQTVSFDAGAIVPDGLPLSIAARGSADVTASATLGIKAGIAITAPTAAKAVTTTTLLSALNGGAGLTAAMINAGVGYGLTKLGAATTATTDKTVLTLVGHGLADGDAVTLETSDTLPAPFAAGTRYFVVDSTATTFALANAAGGAAIKATTAGSGATSVRLSPSGAATISKATPGVVTSRHHGLATGDVVIFSTTGTLPSPLRPNTPYAVTALDAHTFTLATTGGGTPIATTTAGSGTHAFSRPDLVFSLRDGSSFGIDLSSLALGSGASAGTATVANLLTLVNSAPTASGRVSLALSGSTLVATDLTTPASATATFSVSTPQLSLTVGTGAGASVTRQSSLAPVALGLIVAATTDNTLTGASLEASSRRDRLYLSEDSTASIFLKLGVSLEGGAALGPLALTVECGKAEGSAGVTVAVIDPGTGVADDGRIYLSETDGGVADFIDLTVTAPTLDGIFQFGVPSASWATNLGVVAADYRDYCSGVPLATLPGASVPFIDLSLDSSGGGWGFSLDANPRLGDIFSGLGDFSLADLPGMLDAFMGYLEASGLWTFEIPWAGVSLGEILAFGDLFGNLPAFDLGDLLGRPSYDAHDTLTWPDFSLGSLGQILLDGFDPALPDLADLEIFGRLQRLMWTLDDLLVEWEGWTPGSPDVDLDFLGRLRGWFSEATLVFPEVLVHLPDFDLTIGASPNERYPAKDFTLSFGRLLSLPQFGWKPSASLAAFDASLDLAWLTRLDPAALSFPGLDFGGLESLALEFDRLFLPEIDGGLLPAGISLPTGFSIDLTPSLVDLATGGTSLVFDIAATLANASYTVSLDEIDVGGIPIDVTTAGSLAFLFDGEVVGRFGVNLATGTVAFDADASRVSLTAKVDDGDGLVLGASLGGLAGISIGKTPDAAQPSWRKATVAFGDFEIDAKTNAITKVNGPATFTVTGSGKAIATADFAADLPLYIDPAGYVGAVGLAASLSLGATPAFSLAPPSFNGTGTPYGSLADVLSDPSLVFNLDSWLTGAARFIELLRTALASDFIGGLPFADGVDLSGNGFLARLGSFFDAAATIDTPEQLFAWLNAKLAVAPAADETVGSIAGGFTFTLNGSPLDATSADWRKPFSDFLDADDELVVGVVLTGETTKRLATADVDLGMDGLGLALTGDAVVDLVTGFGVNVGLGYSLTRGFFVQTGSSRELTVDAALRLPGAGLSMQLGPLTFALADTLAGDELEASLYADVAAGTFGLSTLDDLFTGLTVSGDVRAELGVDLSAEIFGSGGPGLGVSLAMGFTSTAAPGGAAVAFGDLDADRFFFEITDTYVDLGGLLAGPIKEIFSTVDTFLEPIRPILDLLTSEVPVLSDISKLAGAGAVTVLDVIRATGDGDYDGAVAFIEAVADVDAVIATLGGLAETSRISMGALRLPSGTSGGSSAAVLRQKLAEGATAPDADGFDAGTDIATSPRETTGATAHAYNEVTAGSVTFPLFDDPVGALVDLLFGENPTLVLWDMPDLRAGFRLEQSFPIFPPLFAKFFGGFEFATDFSLGYDTRGIRQAMAGAEVRASKVLNGVFLGDVDASGVDKPELTFTATVGAGAELNVVVAKAGVDAGVEGVLGANLKDNDGDGKVHLDELTGNLRSGPECIFDFEGSLDAFFEASIKVGFSTPFGFVTLWKDTFELFRAELLDWELVTCPPVTPELYHVEATLDPDDDGAGTSGKAFVVNAGLFADRVLPGETEDGDEEFEIDYDSAANDIIIRGYDFEDREPATGIDFIWFDAGLGNDIITVTSNVTLPVWGYGGPGNDRLTGGRGVNTLHGDAGSVSGTVGRDKLMGRDAGDWLLGDGGNDILLGYGGADTLDGGAGADQLYGDDEVGDLADAPDGFGGGEAGADTISGGEGDDLIVAGAGNDTVHAGLGDDTVDGGAGDDLLEGDAGNDKLYGRDGFDRIYGDDSSDQITAFGGGIGDGSAIDVNADLIEGGTGFSYIDGGPGYDLIYAESAATGVTAAATHAAKDATLATHGFTPVLVATGWAAGEAARGSGLFTSVILGGEGNDTIYGTAGRDYIDGGFESDLVEFGAGNDYVLGGPGSDALVVTTDPDLGVVGGNATLFGGDGGDVFDGGDGANWIEGGPGNDEIFARGGADTVYGGTTALGYQHYLDDRSHGRAVEQSLHGGFRATVAADSCGPEIFFYPEVYPSADRAELVGYIFDDLDADGTRDPGEPDAPSNLTWGLVVTDATGAIVSIGNAPGGKFVSPEDGDYAAGLYHAWVGRFVLDGAIIESIPAGWTPSTALIAGVTLGATPSTPPQFGYYRNGRLAGSVKTTDNQPLAGVQVYLDTDADGSFDSGSEPTTSTAADGSYSFLDLRPGSYRIAILEVGVCGRITAPASGTHALTLVSGGSAAAYDFRVSLTTAPVVDGVHLGTDTQAVTWTSVPDGAAELTPIPADEYHYLAFEICTAVGLGQVKQGASLTRLDATPSPESIPLTLLASDPSRPTWVRYEVSKVSGGRTLVPGRYRVVLDDASIASATGALLDGEWTSGVSRYPSGNGVAGTDFVFEFVIGGAAGAALVDGVVVTGMAEQRAVIQGTVWQHDPRESNVGQSVHERGLPDQLVLLSDASGVVQSTVVTAPLDVNGDGSTSAAELGGFRFANLTPGTYTIQQLPVFPWRQATPGGVWQPETLYAIGFDSSAVNPANWKSLLVTIDPATQAASPVRDFSTLEARDLASPAAGVLFITGTSRSGATAGTDRLWRYDVAANTLTDLGLTPGVEPLVGFDALDEGTLIGVSLDGIYRYDIATARWEPRGEMRTAANVPYWPVGDVAVESATKVWVIGTSPKPESLGQIGGQDLLLLDPTVLGGNATRIRSLAPTITEPVIGLETDPQGGLIGLTSGERLYAIQTAAAGTSTWLGTKLVTGLPNFSAGGIARMPAGVVTDITRDEFVIVVTAGQTVTIGFGDVPDGVLLHDGDDFIDGGCGTEADVLHGDDGSDLPATVITEGGNDWIRGRGGDDTIAGGQQGDQLFGDEGRDRITGGDTDANWIEGGDGDDWYLHGGAAADVILGNAGNDGNLAAGGDGLRGGGSGDLIFGGSGDDTLFGGDGDDTLVGGAGGDRVYGEAGTDTLFVIDVVSGGEYAANPNGTLADTYDGGTDADTIVVNADLDSLLTDLVVSVYSRMSTVTAIEIGLLTGGGSANRINATGFSGQTTIRGLGNQDTLLGGSGVDHIWGGDAGDTIEGDGGGDFLFGENGDDTLRGQAGDDQLSGGAGSNWLEGGANDDTYVFGGVFNDTVTEAAGAGTDTLDLTAVAAGLKMLVDPTGSYSIDGYDSDAGAYVGLDYYANTIESIRFGSGGDVVSVREGSALAATIDGGGGTDTLWYAAEAYRWSAWAGAVTVNLTTGTASGLAGATAFENVYGGNGGDTLTGNGSANLFSGGGGNDTLTGLGGNDSLSGGDGSDTLVGGQGDDIYFFARSSWLSTDTVTEVAGEGTDTLDFSMVTGPGGIDAAVGATIDVTFGINRVTVGSAEGIDVVKGTNQADRFRLADGTAFGGLLDGWGIAGYDFTDFDTLDYSAWTSAVAVSYLGALDYTFLGSATGTGNVRALRHVIGGSAADTFTAGGLAVWFEGGDGGDTLTGGVGWDQIAGGAGADTISGGYGVDTLTGDAGNDIISGGDDADWIDGGADDDTISGGAGGDTLVGGLGSDTILGNGGNDVIDGGRGADSLAGGLGDDLYVFGILYGNDTIVENAGEGYDTMTFAGVLVPLEVRLGSVTVISADGTATYAGSSVEWVTGGQGDDLFVMTSPSVTFVGVLEGGGGTNTLRYDAATPAIVAAVAAGQKPNVNAAFDFASVLAVPAITPVTLTVPAASTVSDSTVRSGSQRIVKQGGGTLILSLANSHTEGTAVEAGELVVKNVSALGTGGLEIAAGARVSLDVGTAGIKIGFIKLDGLLDIDRASLTVASGLTPSSLVASLAAGRGGGDWNGATGITSGEAAIAASVARDRRIGWRENGDGSFTMSFTAPGDTNLDGQVDILDAANLFTSGRYDAGVGGSWSAGDFNYDGVVDILDISDFFTGNGYDAGPISQAPAATVSAASPGGLSAGDLAFVALATDPTTRPTPRKRAFATI